jgi:hypothetical protein
MVGAAGQIGNSTNGHARPWEYWFAVPEEVLKKHGAAIGPLAIAVYCALAIHIRRDSNGRCWPSYNRIAALTGITSRAAMQAVQKLESAGLITVERTNHKANTYTLPWHAHRQAQMGSEPGSGGSEPGSGGSEPGSGGSEPGSPKLDPITTSNNHTNKQNKRTHARASERASDVDLQQEEQFGQFWSLYPKKQKKDEARHEWLELAPDAELAALILATLRKNCSSKEWHREEGRYIPQPWKWLREKRYEDETTNTTKRGEVYDDGHAEKVSSEFGY